jgi:NAD(P)-dependent dehydrogenase (short-subunit alcohol dehydrogenase family)
VRILITGGASGLGEGITRRFCAVGDNTVFFTFSKSSAGAADIVAQYPGSEAIACDFTDDASLARLLARIPELDIDVLVNNAIASMQTKHFHQSDPDGFFSSFAANVMPTLRITQQAIKGFRKKKSGRIVTVLSSYVVNRPPVGLSEYVANKAYLQSLSHSWAVENARLNITANCVSPSMMRTALTFGVDERQIDDAIAGHPLGRLVTPDEVADAVLFLAQASAHINGVNMLINSGVDIV